MKMETNFDYWQIGTINGAGIINYLLLNYFMLFNDRIRQYLTGATVNSKIILIKVNYFLVRDVN